MLFEMTTRGVGLGELHMHTAFNTFDNVECAAATKYI